MKKQIAAILLITLALLSLFFSQQSGKQQAQAALDKALIAAVEEDYQHRLGQELVAYRDDYRDERISQISIQTEDSTELITFNDSMKRHVAYQLVAQYVLRFVHPLQPDEVNALLQEQLKKEGVDCPTRIAYHYGDTLTRWSKDGEAAAWAHLVSRQDSLDIKGQMSVEAYADCPVSLIARLSDWPLWPGGLLALAAVGLLCFWRTAPREQAVQQREAPAVLTLNPADGSICAGDRQQRLPRMTFELLELLLEHTNQVVTRQQIVNHLWKGEATADLPSYNNRIERHVLMLRKELADFPDYQIKTIPGSGYMLKERRRKNDKETGSTGL